MGIFNRIIGSVFKSVSSHHHNNEEEDDEEIYYCDCGNEMSETEYFVYGTCVDCNTKENQDSTPDWYDEEEDYGQDADHNGICDHCGKSREYGNCTCW